MGPATSVFLSKGAAVTLLVDPQQLLCDPQQLRSDPQQLLCEPQQTCIVLHVCLLGLTQTVGSDHRSFSKRRVLAVGFSAVSTKTRGALSEQVACTELNGTKDH